MEFIEALLETIGLASCLVAIGWALTQLSNRDKNDDYFD